MTTIKTNSETECNVCAGVEFPPASPADTAEALHARLAGFLPTLCDAHRREYLGSEPASEARA